MKLPQEFFFPIFLETADNIWMQEAYTSSAFDFYYLKPMSHAEGLNEMVQRYNFFDENTYNYLYSIFGGHVRFYLEVFSLSELNIPFDDVIKNLMADANFILNTCLMHVQEEKDQEEIKVLFRQLQSNNFSLKPASLSDVIKRLISCNLLFYNAKIGNLTLQNRLLERAIPKTLEEL